MWNEVISSKFNLDSLGFKETLCEGYFDESKPVNVGPHSRSISRVIENGYYLITPLIPKTSDPNR